MLKYFIQRLIQFGLTLIGVSLITFFLIRCIPGDPVTQLIGERGADPQVVEELKARLGLDKPLLTQYLLFLKSAVQGNMGESIVSKRPVMDEFLSRFPATVELSLCAIFWSTLIGIPLGIFSAIKKNSFFDYAVVGTSLVGYSMPIFWWGFILILFFSVKLGIFPVSGRLDITYDIIEKTGFMLIDTLSSEETWLSFKSALRHLFLPSLVLGTIPLAVMTRMTRSSFIETLGEDYIRAHKSFGLSQWSIYSKYAFKNALIPIITVFGLLLGTLLTGAVLTESIFSWPGVGRWLIKSVEARDYPVIQGGVLYLASIVVFINMCVDFLYIWVQPRLRRMS